MQTKEYYREYYAKNRQRITERTKRYYADNRSKMLGHAIEYNKNHMDVIKRRHKTPAYKEKSAVSAKRYYAANKSKVKAYIRHWYLMRNYNLSLKQYNQMLKTQNERCAVCRNSNNLNTQLFVDHCHKTGKVRGLLCHKCNTGIGMIGDDLESVERVLKYIKNNQ